MTKVEQILEYYREYGPSSPAACARATGIGIHYVHKVVDVLMSRNLLARPKLGIYVYRKDQAGRSHDLQDKMWRAISISQSFTYWDIAQLAGATLYYAQTYIAYLRKQGYVYKVGKKDRKTVFRRTSKNVTNTPIMNRSRIKKESHINVLKNMGWDLMRALRDGKKIKARKICEDILSQLGGNVKQSL